MENTNQTETATVELMKVDANNPVHMQLVNPDADNITEVLGITEKRSDEIISELNAVNKLIGDDNKGDITILMQQMSIRLKNQNEIMWCMMMIGRNQSRWLKLCHR